MIPNHSQQPNVNDSESFLAQNSLHNSKFNNNFAAQETVKGNNRFVDFFHDLKHKNLTSLSQRLHFQQVRKIVSMVPLRLRHLPIAGIIFIKNTTTNRAGYDNKSQA